MAQASRALRGLRLAHAFLRTVEQRGSFRGVVSETVGGLDTPL